MSTQPKESKKTAKKPSEKKSEEKKSEEKKDEEVKVEETKKETKTEEKKEKVKRANAKNIMEKLQNHFNEYLKLVMAKDGFKDKLDESCDEVWEEYKKVLDKDVKNFAKSVIRPFKTPKDKNAPTKRRSDYIFFCMDKRKDVVKEFPTYKVTEISVELGKRWKLLTNEEKKPYQDKSKEDKERYNDEMDGYVKPNATKKTVKKRGSTAYNMFCAEKRARVKKNNEDKTGKEITRILADMWKEVSDERRGKYKKQAEEKRANELKKKKKDDDGSDGDDESETKTKKTVKKAVTGYSLYTKEMKTEFKKENPKMKEKDLMSLMAKKWGGLPEAKKKTYNDKANKMKKE